MTEGGPGAPAAGRGGKDPPWSLWREQAPDTLNLGFRPLDYGRTTLSHFQPGVCGPLSGGPRAPTPGEL